MRLEYTYKTSRLNRESTGSKYIIKQEQLTNRNSSIPCQMASKMVWSRGLCPCHLIGHCWFPEFFFPLLCFFGEIFLPHSVGNSLDWQIATLKRGFLLSRSRHVDVSGRPRFGNQTQSLFCQSFFLFFFSADRCSWASLGLHAQGWLGDNVVRSLLTWFRYVG